MFSVAIAFLAAFMNAVSPSSLPEIEQDSRDRHEVHVAYGDLSISGAVAVLRIRMFADDLALALSRRSEGTKPGHEDDAATSFLEYFRGQFVLEADGLTVVPQMVGRGEDVLGSEPVAWYILRFESDRDIQSLRVVNRLLFELFDDQRNLMNVVDEPSQMRRVFYLTPDQATARFDVPAARHQTGSRNLNHSDPPTLVPPYRRAVGTRPIDQVLYDLSSEFAVGQEWSSADRGELAVL